MTQQTLSAVTDLVHAVTVGALGVFAGAMLTEAGVLVPYWRSLDADSFHAWYSANAARLLRFFGSVTWLAGVSALGWALLANASGDGNRTWAAVTAGLMLSVVAMFPIYFKQANASFLAAPTSPKETARALRRWATYHWLRAGISLGALAAAVAAL